MNRESRLNIIRRMSAFAFRTSHPAGSARLGVFTTPHGAVETPAFMPVATHGTIRGLSMDEVRAAGAQMILSNAFHLTLRPGADAVRELGGLHAFTRWPGPMLTDSGGFQLFSLAKRQTVRDDGIEFRSHIDGALHWWTPESVIAAQRAIGADVIMQLDELIGAGAEESAIRNATDRSLRWLERSRAEFDRIGRDGIAPVQSLFPIVQGGTSPDVRRDSIAGIMNAGSWDGIAIGGVSVGEPKPELYRVVELCDTLLPRERPRYVMGVGFPDDLVECAARGADLFDCVVPTRMGRHGTAFTPHGTVQIRRSSFRMDRRPLVEGCACPACSHYDRAYLRHLFVSEEMLGLRLLCLHNVTFLLDVMRAVRTSIRDGSFATWHTEWLATYRTGNRPAGDL
jgi:queuine tRNA-ribosyltransferase